MFKYEYLKDSAFLKNFDKIKIKEQIVKIVVLNFNQIPINEIQGKVLGGSVSLDGSSGMRRTCNLNLILDNEQMNINNLKNLLSINKKVQVLIGFTNTTEQYPEYPILWFPQGIYAIISISFSHDLNGISISLNLHDKMAFLNGECGGTLSSSVVFNEIEETDENGQVTIIQPTIYQIIQELVNHFGGEQLGKIIISDLDNRIKRVMKWTGSTPLYMKSSLDGLQFNFSTNYEELATDENSVITPFNYGSDVGYIFSDFVFPKELIGNIGDTVTNILDQIVGVLGNYEYFYDINGNFIFREIKNYLNTSYSTFQINQLNENNYLVDYTNGKSVYTFDDSEMILSYSNTPQYQNIKNDFVIWGKRTSVDGIEIPIRYHLAIDKKPQTGNKYKVFFYEDPIDEITKIKKPIFFNEFSQFPNKGNIKSYYYADDTKKIYKWSDNNNSYEQTEYELTQITTTDFRTEFYCSGVESQPFGLDSNYYYTELKNEWPKLYDLKNKKFFEQVKNQSSDIDFFLDFIDTNSAISEFSIDNIGRRTYSKVDDSINCIFQPSYPEVVFIEIGSSNQQQLRQQCINKKEPYAQLRPEIYSLLLDGGTLRSAYEQLKKELYLYTSYNQQVSLSTIPIYYLEPNVRITIRDNDTDINGDYMIQSISLPLDINGTMSISCTKALERF